MPELQQLISLSVVSNTKPIEEVGKAAKEATSEIDCLNRAAEATISTHEALLKTSVQNIRTTMSLISNIENDIKQTDIDIKKLENTLELRRGTLRTRLSQDNQKGLADAIDAIKILGSGGLSASGQNVVDIIIAADISDETRIILANLESGKLAREIEKVEKSIESGLVGNSRNSRKRPLKAGEEEELNQRLEQLRQDAAGLEDLVAELKENDLLKENSIQFEITKLQESIDNTEIELLNLENLRNDQKDNLNATKQNLNDFIIEYADGLDRLRELGLTDEDIKNLGIKLPEELFPDGFEEIDLNFTLPPENQQGLQDHIDLFNNGGSAALAYADANSMVGDTLSDMVNPLQAHKDALEASKNVSADLTDNSEDLVDTVKDSKKQFAQAEKTVGKFDGTAVDLGVSLEKTDEVAQQLGEDGLPKIADGAEEVSKALSDIDIQNLINDLSVEDIAELLNISEEDAKRIQEQLSKGFAAGAKDAKVELDALGVFTSDIAANINDTFADLISNGLQGNFDNLGDIWGATLGMEKDETQENQQNVIFLDEFREKGEQFRLAA